MANKIRVLVDLNVIIDVMQNRQPFYEDSAGVLDAVARGGIGLDSSAQRYDAVLRNFTQTKSRNGRSSSFWFARIIYRSIGG